MISFAALSFLVTQNGRTVLCNEKLLLFVAVVDKCLSLSLSITHRPEEDKMHPTCARLQVNSGEVQVFPAACSSVEDVEGGRGCTCRGEGLFGLLLLSRTPTRNTKVGEEAVGEGLFGQVLQDERWMACEWWFLVKVERYWLVVGGLAFVNLWNVSMYESDLNRKAFD